MLHATVAGAETATAAANLPPGRTLRHALKALDELLQVLKEGVHRRLKGAPKGAAALKQLAAQVLQVLRRCGRGRQGAQQHVSGSRGRFTVRLSYSSKAALTACLRALPTPPGHAHLQCCAAAAAWRPAAWTT